jgi:hypothetical protein
MRQPYALAKIDDPIGDGVSGAYWLQLVAAGKSSLNSKLVVANEFICSRLGDLIGIPIPPFGLFQPVGTIPFTWFGSLSFRQTRDSPPPIIPRDFADTFPEIAIGIVVFDMWIANSDRHEKNLSMDASAQPPRADAFDHSHALFSSEGIPRLRRLMNWFGIDGDAHGSGNRHCLVDHIDDGDFDPWIAKISGTPMFLIENVCSDMHELGLLTEAEMVAAVEFLRFRQLNIRRLIHENYFEFKRNAQPSMWLSLPEPMIWDGPNI